EWEIGQRIEISGTPGAKAITESHIYGGWRAEATDDILNYWSKDSALHDCRPGDYIQYPVAVDHNDNVTQWATGMIYSKFTGIQNGNEFFAVRVVNASGSQLPVNTVPYEARHAAIKFLGKDDGTYKI
ncbi:hypothetical protein DC364_23500, partial [Vibrio vulnificus]